MIEDVDDENFDPLALLDGPPQYSHELGFGEYHVKPLKELSGAVHRVLRIESRTCRKLFEQYAIRDPTHTTMAVEEFVKMCIAAKLLQASPSNMKKADAAKTELTKDGLIALYASVLLGGESEEATAAYIAKFATPKEGGGGGGAAAEAGGPASAPTPGGQINLGNASKSVAGCILLCELEELIARLALHKFADDHLTTDALKVHEVYQMLSVSLKARGLYGRVVAPPGYLSNTVPIGMGGGSYQPVNEVFEPRFVLTTSQQQYEAKANAERSLAVQQLLFSERYAAIQAAKPAKGGDKKGGGKKKK